MNAPDESSARRKLGDVVAACADELLAIEGVVGVAEGHRGGEPVVIVLADALTPRARRSIPERFRGYAVVVDSTGRLQAPPPE